MPELPEVETIARGVHERVSGDRIVEAWFSGFPQPFKTPPARQAEGLEGRVVVGVRREGKHIVVELGGAARDGSPKRATKKDKPAPAPVAGKKGKLKKLERDPDKQTKPHEPEAQWIVHLGMTGRLLVTTPDGPVAAHTHARLSLASGRELRFVDPRRLGVLSFAICGAAGFGAPGAEPLTIAPRNLPHSFAAGSWPSRPLCSTRRCCRAWAIFTPTRASFMPASARAEARAG